MDEISINMAIYGKKVLLSQLISTKAEKQLCFRNKPCQSVALKS